MGLTHVRDLLPFLLNSIAKVFLDHAHRGYGVRTQCLYHLQWRHQAILIYLLQDRIELIACFFQDLGARRKVSKRSWI